MTTYVEESPMMLRWQNCHSENNNNRSNGEERFVREESGKLEPGRRDAKARNVGRERSRDGVDERVGVGRPERGRCRSKVFVTVGVSRTRRAGLEGGASVFPFHRYGRNRPLSYFALIATPPAAPATMASVYSTFR